MKRSIEFLVVDEGLEVELRDAIGPIRRFSVERRTGCREEPQHGSRRMVVTWARHLASRQPLPGAGRGPGTAYLVLVEPDTPVEALSDGVHLSGADRSARLFVGVDDLVEVRSFLRGFVKRLSLAEESERILHAWWMNGSVQILTTSFRRFDVPRRSLPALRGLHFTLCRELEVVLRGTSIVWPRLELEIGFDELDRAARPVASRTWQHEVPPILEPQGAIRCP